MVSKRRIAIFFLVVSMIFLCSVLKCAAEPAFRIPDRDSVNKLLAIIAKTKADSNQVKLYLSLVDYYLYNNEDTCRIFVGKALAISQQIHYKYGEANARLMLGILQFYKSDSANAVNQFDRALSISRETGNLTLEALIWFKRADLLINNLGDEYRLQYFLKAKALYKQVGNRVMEAYVLKCIANIHFLMGQSEISLKELVEVIGLYKSAGHKKLHYTYDLIGAVYRYMGNYDEALKYAIEAVKTAQQTKDTADINLFYTRFGDIYSSMGQYDNSIAYDMIALKRSKTTQVVNNIEYTLHSFNLAGAIGETMVKAGRPKEALEFYLKYTKGYRDRYGELPKGVDGRFLGRFYMMLNQFKLAEKYYLEWLSAETKPGKPVKAVILLQLVDLYVRSNQVAKARFYIATASKSVFGSSPKEMSALYRLQSKVAEVSGDYRNALRYYQLYKDINDSLLNERKIKLVASLQIKFDTERKDQRIQLLTFDNQQQSVILKQRLFQRNVMIVGAALLLILSWFIYNRYQLKNKAALQLEAKQAIINNKNKNLEELLAEKNELLTEKEWLLKEVHHRVKNNLQMVMTLLYTQSNYLKDQQALDAIMESQHRIHAISLIHQKLYQSDNLEVINMKGYIHELVDNLKDSFDKNDTIETELDIDPTELDITRSIPVGLMLNEAVTNAMKYAFQGNQKKVIYISLKKQEEGQIILMIQDNGTGLPAGFDLAESKTLGLKLIQGLCRQIKGDYSIVNNPGVCIRIRFAINAGAGSVLNQAIFENNKNSIS